MWPEYLQLTWSPTTTFGCPQNEEVHCNKNTNNNFSIGKEMYAQIILVNENV